MRRGATILTMFGVVMIGLLMALPAGHAADISKGKAVEYILATAKAARTVYVKGVIADAKKAGVKLSEKTNMRLCCRHSLSKNWVSNSKNLNCH